MRKGQLRYMLAGNFYRLAWVEYGDPAAPVVVCMHGLTRNGRDFDPLAEALSDRFRVICPDLPGRGRSDWLPDATLYNPLSYALAMSHLLARLDTEVSWVGTSLGGTVGMLAAAAADTPLHRLVLNDIGPFIPAAALVRIRDYIGGVPEFADLAALEAHLRRIHAPFGSLTDAQWQHLAAHSARTLANGRLALHYDPAIAIPFLAVEPTAVSMWATWEQIHIPVLAIRGASSDLLEQNTVDRMVSAGAKLHTVADAGHAPALMDAPTIAVIRDFLVS